MAAKNKKSLGMQILDIVFILSLIFWAGIGFGVGSVLGAYMLGRMVA